MLKLVAAFALIASLGLSTMGGEVSTPGIVPPPPPPTASTTVEIPLLTTITLTALTLIRR